MNVCGTLIEAEKAFIVHSAKTLSPYGYEAIEY